jgi:rubrerythrin
VTATVRDVFAKLKFDKNLHGLFLNTLSLLEFAGARKIIKSQKAESQSMELLSHAAEEIRHARVMKSMALKMCPDLATYEPKHLLSGSAAWDYIQSVDSGVERELETPQPLLNYLYTTLIIEERAMEVYPLYAPILAELGFTQALKGLIAEEENHLKLTREAIVQGDPLSSQRLPRLYSLEQEAFSKFMSCICVFLETKNPSLDSSL